MALTITESWIRDRVNLKHDNLDDVKSLSLPGSYHEKIVHLGNSLRGFTRLKHLDLSRNDISVLDGLDHLKLLETLNLYYNNITNLNELYKLRHNANLKEIDLRLNPVTKNEPDYRFFVIHMIPNIKVLDDRSVRDTERKAAISHFVPEQASEFEARPQKQENQEITKRTEKQPRVEMVHNLAPRLSALADDDIALIDLVAKADVGSTTSKLSNYKAETYDSNELRNIPSPHAEKYQKYHSSNQGYIPESERPQSREMQRVYFRDIHHHIERHEKHEYDDYHPFATHGNFTANPSIDSDRTNGNSREQNIANNQRLEARNKIENIRYEGQHEEKHLPKKLENSSFGMNTPKQSRTKSPLVKSSFASEKNEIHHKKSHQNREELDNHVHDQRRNGSPGDNAFVNSSDFRDADRAQSRKLQQNGSQTKDRYDSETLQNHIASPLFEILDLVDKYWNGSRSLQTNDKFQALANNLLSRYIDDHSMHDDGYSKLKRDLHIRDEEIKKQDAELRQKDVDIEKLRRRLQNEDEIQRTIEMTDQDLRRLQQKIEEVQAENRSLKANLSSVTNDRESIDTLRAQTDELKQCKVSLERENHTLSQQCEQHSATLTQLQELTSMLQESHRSLVVTNDHLLQELDEMRQRHQHEVQQLHWSYEQLKKTAEWLPKSTK